MRAGEIGRLGEHRLLRTEMRVETAVGQPDGLHDIDHARSVISGGANGSRGRVDDAAMRLFLTARRYSLAAHVFHIMLII